MKKSCGLYSNCKCLYLTDDCCSNCLMKKSYLSLYGSDLNYGSNHSKNQLLVLS